MKNKMKHALSVLAVISTGTLLTACGGSSSTDSTSSISVSIPFQAVAGDQAIKCGETITGLGTGSGGETGVGTDVKIDNFRMYVHDIKLITDQGIEIPVTLDASQVSQNEDVALLDFRDTAVVDSDGIPTDTCPQDSAGTEDNPYYNDTVKGSAVIDPAYTISYVQFTLGVPFELNHARQTAAEEPLRNPGLASGMTWSWQNGYKFVGFDVSLDGDVDAWNIHLGSTGCSVSVSDLNAGADPEECTAENRPVIKLPLNTVELDDAVIEINYAELVSGSDISQNTEETAAGCMSFAGDPECESIFEKFGLPWDENEAVEQTVFSVVDGSNN